MRPKDYKVTIIDTGEGGGVGSLTAKALARAVVRFFEDESNRKAFEEYQAEKRRRERETSA